MQELQPPMLPSLHGLSGHSKHLTGLQILAANTAHYTYIKAYWSQKISFMIKTFYFHEYIFDCLAILL